MFFLLPAVPVPWLLDDIMFCICICMRTLYYTNADVYRYSFFPRTIITWNTISGADPGFQVRGGALKKIAPSGGGGGGREHFWGISCEKLRFYAKKSYFFQLRREARKFLGYFVWKITILRQKIIFFPILGGGCAPGAPPPPPPPGSAPAYHQLYVKSTPLTSSCRKG